MESNWKSIVTYVAGLLIVMFEPIVLLFSGRNIIDAIWPAAVGSLNFSLALRENMILIFSICFLVLVLVTVIKYLFVKKNLLEEFFADMKQRDKDTFRSLPFILLGYGTSMAVLFTLLNLAYLRGVFILLPAFYGICLLVAVIMIVDFDKLKFSLKELNFHTVYNIGFLIISIVLISPAVPAFIGIAPSPPEYELAMGGEYSYTTTQHPYPMPPEVEDIIGNYEGDIDFSIYAAIPDEIEQGAPLAILLHGFANPGYATYVDWAHVLASNGIATMYIQYPSDVWPETWDTYTAVYENGAANYPHHVPRVAAINSALDYFSEILPEEVDESNLYVGGHSLGAGYALVTMDLALERGWGNESLFVALEASYARPSQEEFAINKSLFPDRFEAHVVINQDDMTVDDCYSYHHSELLGEDATLMTVQSDRRGYPRLVSTHYMQAAETRDTLAEWGFYRMVHLEAQWLLGDHEFDHGDEFTSMGEWSNGEPVNPIIIHEDKSSFNC